MDIQAQLQAIRQQFADELARRDSQIDALSSTITNLQGTVTSLRNTSAPTPKRPKRQLPDPPKFDGTQLHYDTWLAQLQLVLSVDGNAIGDAQAQFAFVYLRLESSPAALCLELLKHANLTKKFDYHLILDQLDRHNGVENKVQRAKNKLHKLVQSGSFHGFLISFEVTLGEASGWNWDDERKIDTLRPCLSDYLKRKLQEHDVAGTTPSKYLDFVSLCKRYASQPSGSANTPGFTSGTAPNPTRQLYDYKADKMDLSTINAIEAINTPGTRSRSRSSSHSTDRSHCHRCGSIDHYVSVCPIQPPAQTTSPPISKGKPGRKQTGKRTTDKDQLRRSELEGEINLLGLSTVLDVVYDYRLNNQIDSDIDSDSESLIQN
jgi:hypothetical protein